MPSLFNFKLKAIVKNGTIALVGNDEWIDFATALFSDIASIGKSNDKNLMLTKEVLNEYFYKQAYESILRFIYEQNISSDSELSTKINDVDFVNKFCDRLLKMKFAGK